MRMTFLARVEKMQGPQIVQNFFSLSDFQPKGWELTFLIRAFGLSERLSIGVGCSDKGLKSQNLRFRKKKIVFFLANVF